MPMINGFTKRNRKSSIAGDDAAGPLQIEARALSRYCKSEIRGPVADGRWRMGDGHSSGGADRRIEARQVARGRQLRLSTASRRFKMKAARHQHFLPSAICVPSAIL